MSKSTGPGFGLVVAAGQGRRFGRQKQFVPLAGRPMLVHSLLAFEQCPDISSVVVVTGKSRIGAVRKLAKSYSLRKVAYVVAGGAERSDSVRQGLAALPDEGIVAVHDAARPLVTPRMITDGMRACRRYGPVTFGLRPSDTVKRTKGHAIAETLDRDELVAVETPQVFPIALLRRAHKAARRQHAVASDDCALVEQLGIKVRWIPSPTPNIKVTTAHDLRLCAALL